MYPRMMPDGASLLFTGSLDTLALGNPLAGNGINQWLHMSDLFITPMAAFAPVFLCSGTRPVVSPDGRMIFVYQQRPGPGPEGREVDTCYGIIFDREGRELKSIYFGPEVSYLGEGFSFSPDGNSFAYAKDGSIWIDTVRWKGAPTVPAS